MFSEVEFILIPAISFRILAPKYTYLVVLLFIQSLATQMKSQMSEINKHNYYVFNFKTNNGLQMLTFVSTYSSEVNSAKISKTHLKHHYNLAFGFGGFFVDLVKKLYTLTNSNPPLNYNGFHYYL